MNNKTVLITGASRGIGAATSRLFASKGYNLIISCSKSYDQLSKLQKDLELEYNISCVAVKADVSNPTEVNYMFEAAFKRFGGVDILINNAGISYTGLLQDMTDDSWDTVIGTNLSSVFYCCKQAIPYMIQQHEGRIINVSSVWGIVGASCEVAYSASKGGINAFTKALAKELGPSNISVNAIAFGVIDTDMNKCYSDEEREELAAECPMGRFASADEAAKFIFDVAQTESFLTGQVLQFDGGWI